MSAFDFTPFCESSDYQRYLTVPHPFDGGAAASNGHVLIFQNGATVADPPEAAKLPDSLAASFASMIALARSHDFAQATPAASLSLEPYQSCARCDGEGFVREATCEDCEDGTFDRGGHEYVCKNCEGNGFVTSWSAERACCPECGGSCVKQDSVKLGDGAENGINTKYLHLLRGLPECVVSWATPDWIAFRFADGCGVVAAMRGGSRWLK